MTMLFCIAESEIKVIHTYIHTVIEEREHNERQHYERIMLATGHSNCWALHGRDQDDRYGESHAVHVLLVSLYNYAMSSVLLLYTSLASCLWLTTIIMKVHTQAAQLCVQIRHTCFFQ